MQRFLPLRVADNMGDTTWPIPVSNLPFAPLVPAFLHRFGAQMHVGRASGAGFVPSPLSRAITFSYSLYPQTLRDAQADDGDLAAQARHSLQQRAQQTFRGIWAFLALRDVVGVDVELRECSVNPTPGSSTLCHTLVDSFSYVHGQAGFWASTPHVVAGWRGADGRMVESGTLCGLSPLTVLYPPGCPASKLLSLFWYDYDAGKREGTWYDPTDPNSTFEPEGRQGGLRVAPSTILLVRSLMHRWLDIVLQEDFPADMNRPLNIRGTPLLYPTELRQLLVQWQEELDDAPPIGTVTRHSAVVGVPFADCVLDRETVPNGESIVTDLAHSRGTVLLSEADLHPPTTRVFGRTMGRKDMDIATAKELFDPTTKNRRPRNHVSRDDLFTPLLGEVGALSKRWSGLVLRPQASTRGDSSDGAEPRFFLFPFHPKLARVIDLEQLATAATIRREDSKRYRVTLTIAGTKLEKVYSTEEKPNPGEGRMDDVILPELADVRVFPDFLTSVGKPPLLSQPEDQKYYVRVRRSPHWGFTVSPLARDAKGAILLGSAGEHTPKTCGATILSVSEKGGRCFDIYEMPAPNSPAGVSFGDRGLALFVPKIVKLPEDANPEWDVAMDFGTTNTCISYREQQEEPRVLDLPVMTSSLVAKCNYGEYYTKAGSAERVSDGAAGPLDFFSLFQSETRLCSAPYFPSQFVTALRGPPSFRDVPADHLKLQNGLAYFENVSLSDRLITAEFKHFPHRTEVGPDKVPHSARDKIPHSERDFSLYGDLKWGNTAWRWPFMAHLRKAILLAAARRGARVRSITFTYPRAFNSAEVSSFMAETRVIWSNVCAPSAIKFITESEALHSFFAAKDANVEHVVLDVGGGTTDLLAMDRRQAFLQSSFRLSTGPVNEYVVKSPRFRRAIVDSAKGNVDEKAMAALSSLLNEEAEKEETKDFVRLAWFGLLRETASDRESGAALLAALLADLRNANSKTPKSPEEELAVSGFFLSLSVLFTSLSFLSGRLLQSAIARMKAKGGNPSLCQIHIHLTGNGARLYDLLTEADARRMIACHHLMERMFKAAFGDGCPPVTFHGIPLVNGKATPKELVALGTVTSMAALNHNGAPIVISPGYVDEDLRWYESFTDEKGFVREPMVDAYLKLFSELLGKGTYEGFCIVPFMGTGSFDLQAAYHEKTGELAAAIRSQEALKADDYRAAVHAGATEVAESVDPRFAVHLLCLLTALQKHCNPKTLPKPDTPA